MKTWLGALSALVMAATIGANIRDASACTPPQEPPPAGTIRDVNLSRSASPKNGGLVFGVVAGADVTDAQITSAIAITVKAGELQIPGALSKTQTLSEGFSQWIWKPTDGVLPAGTVDVAVKAQTTVPHEEQVAITIEDRILTPSLRPMTLSLARTAQPDGSSPKIQCTGSPVPMNPCGPTTNSETQIPSRYDGVPAVNYLLPEAPPSDAPWLLQTVELFGRDKNGTKSSTELRETGGPGGSTTLDRRYDEYCSKLTVRFIGDGTETSAETCVPHGALDLTVTAAEETALVKGRVEHCETTVYPAGTSEADPTGRGTGTAAPDEAADVSGCSATRARESNGDAGAAALTALACLLVGARRRREA